MLFLADMTSKDVLVNLTDNRGRWSDDSCSYLLPDEDYDKGFLRQLSGSLVADLCAQDLLIYPQSFELGDMNGRILEYVERGEKLPATVYTNNMLGFVGKGDTDVFIHSRFSNGNEDYFLHYMLMRIANLSVFDFESGVTQTKDNFGNLLFFLFPVLLQKALSRGILKSYVNRSYNNASIKGKIDLPRHIRYNKPTTGRIAYTVREYSADNVIMQLIRHTIEFLQKDSMGSMLLTNNQEIKIAIRQVVELTPSYSPNEVRKVIEQNQKSPVHPLYAEYRPLQHLCIEILEYKKVTYARSSKKIHGLLFDGAWLWEEYVGKIIHDLMEHRKRVDNKGTIYLFQDELGSFQRIIPDYIGKGEYNIVGDAKYVMLKDRRCLYAEQASAIYYKTIMYMYRFNATKGVLFYPMKQGETGSSFSDYKIEGTDGHLFELGLSIAEAENLKDFCIQMRENENAFLERLKGITGITR